MNRHDMSVLGCGVLMLLLSGCVASQGASPGSAEREVSVETKPAIIRYNARVHPVLADGGMVVSQNEQASEIGRSILARGGNAADAAVATGFALAVTLPRAGNLGGSGFSLTFDAQTRQSLALDYRSAGPAAFDADKYRNPEGLVDTKGFTFGPAANGVPGTVAGLYKLWQKQGSLPWAELVEPARRLAADGIVVSADLEFALAAGQTVFQRYPSSAAVYLKPDGKPYQLGDIWRQADLADSLELIASNGAETFYRGELASRIVDGLSAAGGLLTLADLAQYEAREREPLAMNYRNYQVLAQPPVSGGGLTLLQMLAVLERFDLADKPQGSARSLHLLAEIMKWGTANRRFGIGDPDYVDVATERFLAEDVVGAIVANIDLDKARAVETIEPFTRSLPTSRDTTHFSVVDRWGNAVATTYTLGYSFGSGFVVPGTGILLDNQLRNFSYNRPGHANRFAPGKRMVSTMTPTIVLNSEGRVELVTGTPGGSRIINVIFQLLVNVLDYEMNVADATHAPRIHQAWRWPELHVEEGVSADTIELLRALGHDVVTQATMGSAQSIRVREGLLRGSADPRRPGAAAKGVIIRHGEGSMVTP
ncbi:MAG: gamma-glutamyltransferase [Pseudomonadaceae bacterium]|nr:gamma-glutamyltransferase [Pseudomonadaceae bacterium]